MLKLRIWDRHSNSPIYFDICRDSYENYLVALEKWLAQPITPSAEDFPIHPLPAETRRWIELCREAEKHRAISVVFGALCLEAFIHDYGASALSDAYVKNYLDGIGLKAKWIVIPKLVTGKEFPTDGQAFQYIGELMQERNRLVHHKSKPMEEAAEFTKKVRQKLRSGEAFREEQRDLNPYQTVIEVLTELSRIDTCGEKERCWRFEEVEAD